MYSLFLSMLLWLFVKKQINYSIFIKRASIRKNLEHVSRLKGNEMSTARFGRFGGGLRASSGWWPLRASKVSSRGCLTPACRPPWCWSTLWQSVTQALEIGLPEVEVRSCWSRLMKFISCPILLDKFISVAAFGGLTAPTLPPPPPPPPWMWRLE